MARSGSEASRLVKQGAVQVGGCSPDCTWFNTGRCACGGWQRMTDPVAEVAGGDAIKVGTGMWRLLKKDGSHGFDQVPGVGRVPWDLPYEIVGIEELNARLQRPTPKTEDIEG